MQPLKFYMETAKYAAIKKLLILCGILPGAFLIFTLLLNVMGEHGKFVRTCTKLSIPVGLIFVGCWVAGLIIYFRFRSSCVVQAYSDGSIEIAVQHYDGTQHRAHGFWMCNPLYTSEYYKYGTYRKHLQLVLYCNEVIFGIFRQELAPVQSVPAGFREVNQEVGGAPTYFTKETLTIYGLINSINRHRYQIPMQY